ncbi:MAG: DUF4384 domain-containing protein [Bacteroidales bacterium]|jgi:hypothetical protein|nr:DUF4384 domain-containing protein [Bacteroidales bacterium]
MNKISLFVTGILLFSANLWAQKAVKVCGEYTYYAPENVSIEQAKRMALDRARLQIVAEKFGTNISQNNVTMLINENEQSDVRFRSLMSSEAKGEWLSDASEPQFTVAYKQDMLIVKVEACGNVREKQYNAPNFAAKVLRNGTEPKFESTDFTHNDDMFLWFRSPTAGYAAVYLVDETNTAYCLLPYRNDSQGSMKIQHGKDYVFFSKQLAHYISPALVDEYSLTASKDVEYNFLYIIFSPNEFYKANDMQANSQLPRQLSFDEFQRWRVKNRNNAPKMTEQIMVLTIKK